MNAPKENAVSKMQHLQDATPVQQCITELIQHGLSNKDKHEGLMTGFFEFDAFVHGLHPGDLVVLAGSPGVGKTAFSLNLAEQVAVHQRKPVVFVSTGSSAKQLSLRLASCMARVDANSLRAGQGNDLDHSRFTDAIESLYVTPLCFIDDVFDVNKLFKRLKNIVEALGQAPALTIIDNLHLVAEQPGGSLAALRQIKRLARKIGTPILLTSNVASATGFRSDKRPQLNDLIDSESIEVSADIVMSLYRDELFHEDSPDFGTAELSVLKWANGQRATFRLAFLQEWSRFCNTDDIGVVLEV